MAGILLIFSIVLLSISIYSLMGMCTGEKRRFAAGAAERDL